MVWRVHGKMGGEDTSYITITYLISLLSGTNPPKEIKLPFLGNQKVIQIKEGDSADMEFGVAEKTLRVMPLFTCACVIFQNQSGLVYVHHAKSGSISLDVFKTAMKELDNPGENNVCCVYAHPGKSDPDYQKDIQKLVDYGMDSKKIVEIEQIDQIMFGINNFGQIGF